MEKINEFWVEYHNKWSCKKYSKETAISSGKCMNSCMGCIDCKECIDCFECKRCDSCYVSNYCRDCYHDIYCYNCKRCRDCRDCKDCHRCFDCTSCEGLQNCKGFLGQPEIYITNTVGLRNERIYFYYGFVKNMKEKQLQVIHEFSRSDLGQFEKEIIETYGNGLGAYKEMYLKEYLKEIEKVKVLFEL